MRKFNKQLSEDIENLKHLHTKVDKTEFNTAKAEVMKKHSISRATVYREMKKVVPGFYKTPRYWPPAKPITAKHKEMVRAMYQKQMNGEQVRAEMERLTGESWPWERLQKIRKSNDADAQFKKDDTKRSGRRKKSLLPVESDAPKIETFVYPLTPDPKTGIYESPNGQDMKIFLEALLNADKIDQNSYLLVRYKGFELMLGYEELKTILLFAANSAACRGRNAAYFSQIALVQLNYQQIRLYSAGAVHTPNDLKVCTETLHKYADKPLTESIDFEFLYDVVKYYDPDADRESVITVCLHLAENHPEASKRIIPQEESLRIIERDAIANR